MPKLHHTTAGVAMVAGAMERGLLMLKPAPTTVDTTAVITGKGLPRLRLPLDAMEVVDGVVVVDTGAKGLLMLKPAPTMAGVDMVAGAMERGLLMLKPAPTTVDTTAVI